MRTASPSTPEGVCLVSFTDTVSHDCALSWNVCISTLGNTAFSWGAPPQCWGDGYSHYLLFLYLLAFSWLGFANPPLLKSPVNSLCWIFSIQFFFVFSVSCWTLTDTIFQWEGREGFSVLHRKKSCFAPGISAPRAHLPNNTLAPPIGCSQQMVITGLNPFNAGPLKTPTSLTPSFPASLPIFDTSKVGKKNHFNFYMKCTNVKPVHWPLKKFITWYFVADTWIQLWLDQYCKLPG